MKIIGICKTFRGNEFAIESLNSCYNHLDQMIYIHGETDWLGRPGNNVRALIEGAADPDKKSIHFSAPPKYTQAQQYEIAIDYLLGKGIEFDYLYLVDTDEVISEKDWATINQTLAENASLKTPVLAYKCRLHTYIKSPFYRIEPTVTLQPVTFIHRAAVKPGIIGIRGSTLSKGARLLSTVYIHHFTSVRYSLDDVWAKHETSCGSEKEPLCDKETWVKTIWNNLPFSKNLLPLKNHIALWAGVKVVTLNELPEIVHKNQLVLAWIKHDNTFPHKILPIAESKEIIPAIEESVITPAMLVAARLPPDFSPAHKLYKFPSFQYRYLALLKKTTPTQKEEKQEDTLIGANPIERIELPVTHSKNNSKAKHTGSLCVTTIVSGEYQWYVPLFIYCLKLSNHGATPLIYLRGPCELPGVYKALCVEMEVRGPLNGFTTAALRFAHSDARMESFDYTLITDIDILMQPETINLVDQHVYSMKKHGLKCYDNYISTNTVNQKKVPGVHFVTGEWWKATAEARATYRDLLERTGSPSWEFDELMLYKIISESGLPEPPKLPNLWAHHGVHLGDWRRIIDNKRVSKKRLQADKYMFVQKLVGDRNFRTLVNECGVHLPVIKRIFDQFKKLYFL